MCIVDDYYPLRLGSRTSLGWNELGNRRQPAPIRLSIDGARVSAYWASQHSLQRHAKRYGARFYTWRITSGTLPAGLSLSGNGIHFRNGGAAGSSVRTAKISDAASTPQNATALLSIMVTAGPLSITTTSPLRAILNAPYAQSLAATGGFSLHLEHYFGCSSARLEFELPAQLPESPLWLAPSLLPSRFPMQNRCRRRLPANLATLSIQLRRSLLNTTTTFAPVRTLNQNLKSTPANISSGRFGKIFSYSVDGDVYAQPLYVPNVGIPGKGMHNVIYIVTEHDSVYASDADSNSGGIQLHSGRLASSIRLMELLQFRAAM